MNRKSIVVAALGLMLLMSACGKTEWNEAKMESENSETAQAIETTESGAEKEDSVIRDVLENNESVREADADGNNNPEIEAAMKQYEESMNSETDEQDIKITSVEYPEEWKNLENNAHGVEEGTQMTFASFMVKDINGEEYSQKIFENKKITIVYCWVTWSEICEKELQTLQEMSSKLPENCGIISVCYDAEEALQRCQEIVKKEGIRFPVLVGNEEEMLGSEVEYGMIGYPVTLFVDQDGNCIETRILGEIEDSDTIKSIIDGLI